MNVLVVMVSVFPVLTASISTNVLLTITAVPTQLVSITTADTNAHAMKVSFEYSKFFNLVYSSLVC